MGVCPVCGVQAVDPETGVCSYCAETSKPAEPVAEPTPAPTPEPIPEPPTV